jgi:hypothetical protein
LSNFRAYRLCRAAATVEPLNPRTGRVAGRADGACSKVLNAFGGQARLDHQYSEETMQDILHDESRPSRVRVAFEEGALWFMLSKDATFEDLADRLRDLDERHHGKPVAIEVKLAASPDTQGRRLVSGPGRSRGIGTAAPKRTPIQT